MFKFSDDNDPGYLTRVYSIQANYEVFNGIKSDRIDRDGKLQVTIFLQAGRPEFMDCSSDRVMAKCPLPKACVVYIDGLVMPALNMRWKGESFEVDIFTVGDEYVLGFSFEQPAPQPDQL